MKVKLLVLILCVLIGCNDDSSNHSQVYATSPDGLVEIVINYSSEAERQELVKMYSSAMDECYLDMEFSYKATNNKGWRDRP